MVLTMVTMVMYHSKNRWSTFLCVPVQDSDNVVDLYECYKYKRVKSIQLTGIYYIMRAETEVKSAQKFNVTLSPQGQSFMSNTTINYPTIAITFIWSDVRRKHEGIWGTSHRNATVNSSEPSPPSSGNVQKLQNELTNHRPALAALTAGERAKTS